MSAHIFLYLCNSKAVGMVICMNLELLETYLNIVRTRSLTKTSELMFVSQSVVSNRLARLEQQLDTRLVERSPGQKRILLTQKGIEFKEFAQQYLELEQKIQDWSSGNTTEVFKVASVTSLTDYILSDFYPQLLRKRKISVTLSTHWTDRIISMLENKEVDVGITPRVFYSKTIDSLPLFEEPLFLVSNSSVSSYSDHVSAKDLKRSDEIYFDWGHNFVEWHDRQMNPLETPLVITDTPNIIAKLLLIPNSFSIIPSSIFKYINSGSLKLSRISPEPPNRICYLLKSKEIRSFKQHLFTQFEEELHQYICGLDDIVL